MLTKKKTIAASLLGLALGALSLSAQAAAGASAWASINDFRYQLIDMNPMDGIAPSITFTSYSSSGDSWGVASGDSRTTLGGTGVFEVKGSATTEATHTAITSSATAVVPDYDYSRFTSSVEYSQKFTLSADTLVIFSAASSLSAIYDPLTNAAAPLAFSELNGRLDADPAGGDPTHGFSFMDYVSTESLPDFDSTLVGTLFSAHRTAYGSVTMRADANARWDANLPPAVPEPGTYAMLLAGLGLVAAVSRRKRANARRWLA